MRFIVKMSFVMLMLIVVAAGCGGGSNDVSPETPQDSTGWTCPEFGEPPTLSVKQAKYLEAHGCDTSGYNITEDGSVHSRQVTTTDNQSCGAKDKMDFSKDLLQLGCNKWLGKEEKAYSFGSRDCSVYLYSNIADSFDEVVSSDGMFTLTDNTVLKLPGMLFIMNDKTFRTIQDERIPGARFRVVEKGNLRDYCPR